MTAGVVRIVCLAAAGAIWLAGCNTASLNGPAPPAPGPPEIRAETPDAANGPLASAPEATGSVAAPSLFPPLPPPPTPPGPPPPLIPSNLTPSSPNDDLSVAKENYRQGNYGLAEHYFRRAVEAGPRDAEAWLGLAASYDRLRRFDLADRAYEQLTKLTGATPAVLNNIGFSYMLRGEFARARETLLSAQAQDPSNPYIANNLALLEKSARRHKAVR